jgi:hypothetical protein
MATAQMRVKELLKFRITNTCAYIIFMMSSPGNHDRLVNDAMLVEPMGE